MAYPEPFYCKIVTASDLLKLSINPKSIGSGKFPDFAGQRAQDIVMWDEENEKRSFRLWIRTGRNKKPVLSAGWRKYVRDRHVAAGFKVGFFKEIDGATGEVKFKIRVARPVFKLFGRAIKHAALSCV